MLAEAAGETRSGLRSCSHCGDTRSPARSPGPRHLGWVKSEHAELTNKCLHLVPGQGEAAAHLGRSRNRRNSMNTVKHRRRARFLPRYLPKPESSFLPSTSPSFGCAAARCAGTPRNRWRQTTTQTYKITFDPWCVTSRTASFTL